MKSKLNLTLDEELLRKAKHYASVRKISLSQLFEQYLQKIIQPPTRKNIIQEIEKLNQPDIAADEDLKKRYYEEQLIRHGS